jgi:DNA modification methylase
MSKDLFGNDVSNNPLLRDRFIEPPFSILDTKGGGWQARKRQWKQLGIQSHLGRGAECNVKTMSGLTPEEYEKKYGRKPMDGTSIFDPALCELIYNWYCPEGGAILDPFAGGSVRGIVANYLGYKYTGIDIRQEQVDSNREQASELLPINNQPQWYVGDSNKVLDEEWQYEFDFIFSCPPYSDLEVYSDMADDLSNMGYNYFIDVYSSIISKSIGKLKNGSYACFVVGDIRDKKGYYRDFVSHTKTAFINSGAKLYNEAILLQPLGTAMLRAGKIFDAGKKLTKVHENVLVFKKE